MKQHSVKSHFNLSSHTVVEVVKVKLNFLVTFRLVVSKTSNRYFLELIVANLYLILFVAA